MGSRRGLGFWEASAIGVGGMVGGGIFAVLGLAVQLAGGGVPLAFALAGAVALLTSYSYAKLSVTFPSEGGTVHFLVKAFGPGVFSGGLNILLWLSYVVMLALYASAFGSYGASFFSGAAQTTVKHVLITAVVIVVTGLNLMAAEVIGKAEDWIVGIKLAILLLFVGVGVWSIEGHRLAVSTWSPALQLLSGGMIIFVAYEGFELIANTAKDVRDPARTLPRAFYASVSFVVALYVTIAIVTVGNLSLSAIVGARDYALAEAARPFLGEAGFVLIAVAALLSTTSAINATLYGAGRLAYAIARDGQLPRELERKIWRRPIEGLLITSALTVGGGQPARPLQHLDGGQRRLPAHLRRRQLGRHPPLERDRGQALGAGGGSRRVRGRARRDRRGGRPAGAAPAARARGHAGGQLRRRAGLPPRAQAGDVRSRRPA